MSPQNPGTLNRLGAHLSPTNKALSLAAIVEKFEPNNASKQPNKKKARKQKSAPSVNQVILPPVTDSSATNQSSDVPNAAANRQSDESLNTSKVNHGSRDSTLSPVAAKKGTPCRIDGTPAAATGSKTRLATKSSPPKKFVKPLVGTGVKDSTPAAANDGVISGVSDDLKQQSGLSAKEIYISQQQEMQARRLLCDICRLKPFKYNFKCCLWRCCTLECYKLHTNGKVHDPNNNNKANQDSDHGCDTNVKATEECEKDNKQQSSSSSSPMRSSNSNDNSEVSLGQSSPSLGQSSSFTGQKATCGGPKRSNTVQNNNNNNNNNRWGGPIMSRCSHHGRYSNDNNNGQLEEDEDDILTDAQKDILRNSPELFKYIDSLPIRTAIRNIDSSNRRIETLGNYLADAEFQLFINSLMDHLIPRDDDGTTLVN